MLKIIQVFFVVIAAFVFLGVAMYVTKVVSSFIDKKRGKYTSTTIHDSEIRSEEDGKETN